MKYVHLNEYSFKLRINYTIPYLFDLISRNVNMAVNVCESRGYGVEIRTIRKGIFSKDIELWVRGTVFAYSKDDADCSVRAFYDRFLKQI